MNSQRMSNDLNLALDVNERVRSKTLDLDVGFNRLEDTWEVIVKYSGNLDRIRSELNADVTELLNGYAVITISQSYIDQLLNYNEIEFIDKPKRLFFSVNAGKAASCITAVQTAEYNLFGEGTLVAVIDSGIDYSHPDFRNEDGTTRIAALWDQTIPSRQEQEDENDEERLIGPPEGFVSGTLYTREIINEALAVRDRAEQLQIVPSVDISGHGTHVAGIAAGNGRARSGLYRGVASQSELIIVKLGSSIGNSYPRTTRLMEALDFVIRTALELQKPVAINLSFGNNYGSHDGNSILENYMDSISLIGRTSIVVGTGNEGALGHHAKGILQEGSIEEIELAVGPQERTINVQIWKNYYDDFDIEIITPSGSTIGPIQKILGTQDIRVSNTELYLYYGEPSPINRAQEIYIEFVPIDTVIDSGIWRFRLIPQKIVAGNYDMWLPTGEAISAATKFLRPSEETTLTVPSTASSVISVGSYNANLGSYSYFSGRGYTRGMPKVKPDIVAPGVDIMSTAPGGGYTMRTGTSMATPFVTGSAALLMQWGILEGNDPYLYGEKMKTLLIAGARHLDVEPIYPNPTLGFGTLCLRDSLNWARNN